MPTIHYLSEYEILELPSTRTIIGLGFSIINDDTAISLNPINPLIELLPEEPSSRVTVIKASQSKVHARLNMPINHIGNINSRTVPINTTHTLNYYHFLIESLPSLLAAIKSKAIKSNDVVLTGPHHISMREAFSLVTENKLSLFELKYNDCIISNKSLMLKPSAHLRELRNGTITDGNYFNSANVLLLRKHILKVISEDHRNKFEKIFVVRRSFSRNITNIAELIEIAENHGYAIINPEQFTFYDQVRIFNSCKRVIGPTGAWCSNIVFCNQDCDVTILYPNSCRTEHGSWRDIGDLIGLKINNIYCNITSFNDHQPIHSDYNIEPEEFRALC